MIRLNSFAKKWLVPALFSQVLISTALMCTGQTSQQTNTYSYKKGTPDGTGKFYMGREIAQVMGAAGASWLERNSRQKEENTNLAISKFPVTASSVVADIGAGSGYYTFRIAPRVPDGKVFAVEIQDEMITLLNNRKKELDNKNVEIIKSDSVSPHLPDASVDLAFMVDVYHELLFPHEMLQNIRKALKKDGKLLLMEYKAENPAVAIKALHKMSVEQVKRELVANGFTFDYLGDFLPIQHLMIFKKKD
ncbi:MAG: class I SAM-dependent methyltransferase [Bacteroidota bacterium]